MRNSSFEDYSTAISVKGAPILFIVNSAFQSLQIKSFSSLISATDLLSSLLNSDFSANATYGYDYNNYVQSINSQNLSLTFNKSLPTKINQTFDLDYAIVHPSQDLIFLYRIYQCSFQDLIVNRSNLIEIDISVLQQSLVSIDENTFININLVTFQDSILHSTTVYSMNFAFNELTQLNGKGSILNQNQIYTSKILNNFIHDNDGSSFLKLNNDENQGIYIANNRIQNIQSDTTYITIGIDTNIGSAIFKNNTFDSCNINANTKTYKQVNFIAVSNELTQNSNSSQPNFSFKQCTFTNIVLYKNHPLIKQYQNSFLVMNLADDILSIEDCTFDSISINYDNNLLVTITNTFRILNSVFSNIQNFDRYGSIYILAETVLVDNSQFINNSAINGNGGVFYIDYDSIIDSKIIFTVQNSFFQNNIALQGSAIYYTTKSMNFSALNNTFIDNTGNGETGSLFYFFNTTFLSYLCIDNNVTYVGNTSADGISLFYMDSIKSEISTSLEFKNLRISLTSEIVGTVFDIRNTNSTFVFDKLSIFNESLSSPSFNEFSIMSLKSGNISILNSSITNLASNSRSLIEVVCEKDINTSLLIKDSEFSSITLTTEDLNSMSNDDSSSYTGIIYLSDKGGKYNCNNSLLIASTNFEKLNYEKYGDELLDPSVLVVDYRGRFNLLIDDTKFQDLAAQSGPAIRMVNSPSSSYTNSISITRSNFINTTSLLEGGAIYNEYNLIELKDNNFSECRSILKSGGSIFTVNSLDFNNIMSLNTFKNSSRYYNFTFNDSEPIGTSPIFLNLSFVTPSYIKQQTVDGEIRLSNFSTYDLQNVNISVSLVDALNQTFFDTHSVETDQRGLSLQVLGEFDDSRDCNYSMCLFSGSTIQILGNSSQIIPAQLNYKSTEFDIPAVNFSISLRDCINGELDAAVTKDDSGAQCIPCSTDTYALDVKIDTTCKPCPGNATCWGGNSIILNQGYWRSSEMSDLIIECRIPSACLGGYESKCAEGYVGRLCDSCDVSRRWIKDKDTCEACPPPVKSLLKAILVLIVVLAYQLWFIKAARISSSFSIAYSGNTINTEIGRKVELKITQGMYIRLLTTYFQILAIISTFGLDFSRFFSSSKVTFEILANPSTALLYSSPCLFLDLGAPGDKLLYYKVGFVIVLPLLKAVGILIFNVLVWRFKINPKRLAILIQTAVCLFLLEQPSVAQELFSFLTCTQIPGDDNYYLQEDLGYQCYSSDYYIFRNFIVIPAFLIYIIVIPSIFIAALFMNRHNLQEPKFRMNFGALYIEYQPSAYFWGICLMLMKLVLVYLGSTLNYDVKTKALSVFVILYIYYMLYLKFHPYDREALFKTEKRALVAYLVTIFGSIYYKDNTSALSQWLTIVTVTFLNLYVGGLVLWRVLKMYLLKLRDKIFSIFRRTNKNNDQLDIDFSNVGDENTSYDISLHKVEDEIFGKDENDTIRKETELTKINE